MSEIRGLDSGFRGDDDSDCCIISPPIIPYLNQFPLGLRRYISSIKDVKADGNCGFRVVAASLGMTEDGYIKVRQGLVAELSRGEDLYRRLFPHGRFDELKHALSYYDEGMAPYEHWMTMPEMGYLIASCYKAVVFFMSSHQCLTFLPLSSEATPQSLRKHICFGFVNNNHFVQVFLKKGHPVPPVVNNWYKFRDPVAKNWDVSYLDRINMFKNVVSSKRTRREIIEIS